MSKVILSLVSIAVVMMTTVLVSSRVVSAESPEQPDRVEVGQEALVFELESLDGARLSLAALRGEAPLVLIFFRGTW